MHDYDDRHHFREMVRRTDEILARVRASPYLSGDARDAFLNASCGLISNYCITLGLQFGALQLKPPIDEDVDLVLKIFADQSQNAAYYRAKQRLHLFLDVFCAFEDAIRSVDEAVVSQERREADEATGEPIGIPTIWKRVIDVTTQTAPSTRAERQRHYSAVRFFARTRNTIHRNNLYQGAEVETLGLTDDGIEITLTPGERTNFLSEPLLPLIVDRLLEAWEFLRTRLSCPDLIPTPGMNETSPYRCG